MIKVIEQSVCKKWINSCNIKKEIVNIQHYLFMQIAIALNKFIINYPFYPDNKIIINLAQEP